MLEQGEETTMKFTGILAAAALAVSLSPDAGKATDLRLLASWDSSFPPVGKVLTAFTDHLESNVESLSIKTMGPETIPPFEQLDPVQRGLFDMLFTHGSYHYNDLSVGMALDTLKGSVADLRDAEIISFVDAQYQEIGMKVVAVLADPRGYQVVLKDELTGDGLAGRKIRGTPSYHAALEKLGASPVVLPGGEIYPALERGTIDGAAWPIIGALSFRWFEVADYLMRPSFGQSNYLVLMNLDKWNGLDDATRQQIEAAAQEFEQMAVDQFTEIVESEEAQLIENGMQETQLTEEQAADLQTGWFIGQMNLAATVNPDKISKMRELAKEAGLSYE
ncbi:C4-dicarboxylate ABC transporter substrate-binding protein [Arenibacterium halophilum]|uniref:C4-dicarboxylate ABC transporter substrate-binding protein n=2 Tax=Arenibacterium halophilum TaxID=2583821 RepID=A0ABY2XFB8_9RHOB|nr:C4-dicarboxylate ABC transporter substrate-binding protein [Arenibacterium halophilum]